MNRLKSEISLLKRIVAILLSVFGLTNCAENESAKDNSNRNCFYQADCKADGDRGTLAVKSPFAFSKIQIDRPLKKNKNEDLVYTKGTQLAAVVDFQCLKDKKASGDTMSLLTKNLASPQNSLFDDQIEPIRIHLDSEMTYAQVEGAAKSDSCLLGLANTGEAKVNVECGRKTGVEDPEEATIAG